MNSIPWKIRFLPDPAVECCLTHSLLAILLPNILIWKLFTGMNSFAFISSYSQCHQKGKKMLSECKFFSCLKCFWLREKEANQKSTNSKAKIIKPQKSEKEQETSWRGMSQQRSWAGRPQCSWVTYLCHSMSDFLTIKIQVSEVDPVCCYQKEPAN